MRDDGVGVRGGGGETFFPQAEQTDRQIKEVDRAGRLNRQNNRQTDRQTDRRNRRKKGQNVMIFPPSPPQVQERLDHQVLLKPVELHTGAEMK